MSLVKYEYRLRLSTRTRSRRAWIGDLARDMRPLDTARMNNAGFDHEKLDVYRLSIEYVAFSYGIAKSLSGVNRHVRDQWLRAAQSIPLNIAEGNGKNSLKDKNRYFEIARGSALECAAVHDIVGAIGVIDQKSNQHGKTQLKRIVSMLTRLVQRT